eukprot:CAMPEP_0176472174 /NCGR_PEP_ID=MMETSP0127-20121128/41596_1 /TAXON_ID=938130 /ORGANISM="Platyophrya macrostoma, Strain WH" /LENGTH=174 /DNA_ID=CAMNT_0017867013 /DNA_START=200 /DNA_END=724 /DNA_ORIENTATION=+
MYQAMYSKAKAENIHSLKLYVEEENESAQKAYVKLGMANTKEEMLEIDFALSPARELHFEKVCAGISNISEYSFRQLRKEDLVDLNLDDFISILDETRDKSKMQEGLKKCAEDINMAEISVLTHNEKVIGILSAFYEYHDWINSIIYWANDLRIKCESQKEQKELTAQQSFHAI